MDKISRILKFSLVLLVVAALTSCGSAEETTAPGPTVQGISLSITNNTCPSVEINLNDEVKWTNEDVVERPLRVEYPDGLTISDLGVV